jgi:hypothetical protein
MHSHHHQSCQRIVEHALKHQGPTTHLVAHALNRTQLAKVLSGPVTNDVLTRVPASGAINASQGNYAGLEIQINLDTATKEAVGNTLVLSAYKADGSFVSGINWASYGHQFTITLPDGTVVIDPDPTIDINILQLGGQDIYLTYQAHGIVLAGATVSGLK